MKSLGDEAAKVMTFLQRRGHSADEACAIMGVALAQLIDNREMLENFIGALRAEYRVVRGLVRLAAMLLTLAATPAAAIDCTMVIDHLNVCGHPCLASTNKSSAQSNKENCFGRDGYHSNLPAIAYRCAGGAAPDQAKALFDHARQQH